MMRRAWLEMVVGVSLSLGCGGQQPVKVPPSADDIHVGSCWQVTLQSHWGARTPVPASSVSAKCADSKICKAHVSQQRAGLVYVRGEAPGSSLVEFDFRDPVSHEMEHRTTRLTFVGEAKKSNDGDGLPPASGTQHESCGPDEF